MDSLQKVAQELGWEYQKNYLYGKVGNTHFTFHRNVDYLRTANNYIAVYIPIFTVGTEQRQLIIDYLKQNRKVLKVRNYNLTEASIIIVLNAPMMKLTTEKVNELTTNLSTFFDQQGILTEEHCFYCGEAEVDAVSKVNKVAVPAHSACIDNARKEMMENQENVQAQGGNYFPGMVGAILGGIIGAIPWMLLEYFWGYASILSLLIGYFAFKGYKLLGGRVTKATKWLLLIPVVLAIIVSNLVSLTIFFVSEGYLLIIENYVIAYTDPEIASVLFINLGIGLLFAALGYGSVYQKVKAEEVSVSIE